MDSLIRFGFTIEEINILMDSNEDISLVSDNDVNEIINILKNNNCSNDTIKNIFICNPFSITNSIIDTNKLIDKLKELGFNNINLLLDTNPYILNMSDKSLEKLYNKKKEEGLNKDEIIDFISYNII
ncbi:MAG: hypothetical protein IKF47_03800 [Bacilli bacterium]|nr:hypothetical protein [Bacilli bacterium]